VRLALELVIVNSNIICKAKALSLQVGRRSKIGINL
jgi:hypothetical protein